MRDGSLARVVHKLGSNFFKVVVVVDFGSWLLFLSKETENGSLKDTVSSVVAGPSPQVQVLYFSFSSSATLTKTSLHLTLLVLISATLIETSLHLTLLDLKSAKLMETSQYRTWVVQNPF